MRSQRNRTRGVLPALLLTGVVLIAAGTAQAAIINVTAGAVDTTVNGNCSLIEAIQAANTDSAVDACTAGSGADTIVIPAGTYTLTVVASMTAAGASGLPAITSDITLQGAGAATTIIERSTAMGTPAFRHLQNLSTLTVTGVTLRNGSDTVVGGGAIYDGPGAMLTVSNSVFSDNTAVTDGGAITTDAAAGATIVITDTTFTSNSATGSGGALRIEVGSSVSCLRCVFSANSANNSGGGISGSGDLTLTDSLVTNNMATSFGGGLIGTQGAVIQISGTTFSGNTTNIDFAGILFADNVTATIVNSTISGNMAGGSIGGAGTLNTATLTLNNVTITNNTAAGVNGAAGGLGPTGGTVTFANTIIAGNMAPTGPDCFPTGGATFTSMGFNLVGNNSDCGFALMTGDQVGTGAAPIDPFLAALANNGGPTAGATPTAIPTHFPQPGSPALDAGNNTAAPGSGFPACEADDQLGQTRPAGTRCDIGAIDSIAEADLALTKADNADPVVVGDSIVYTLTVTNNGPNTAADVQVVDLPASVVFVSAVSSQGTCAEAGLFVTCDLGSLASAGVATIALTVTTTGASVPMVSNNAEVTTSSNDPNLADNSDSEDTAVSPQADIAVTKTDSADPVDVGDNITYTVTVSNNGPDNATGVSLMDTLPASVNFVSATPSQGMCAEAGGLVTCNLGSIANGNSATVSIVVTTTANAIITNTVTVSADGADSNSSNNQASQTTSVGSFADLILSMSDSPDPVPVQGNLIYTATVANAGPDQATGVTFSNTVPSGVNFGSVNTTLGSCSQVSGMVVCSIGTLAAQASATVTLAVVPQTAGLINNTVTVTFLETDPDLNNNTVSVNTEAVDFTISVAPASVTVTRGNTAVYMVTLTPVGSRFDFAITLSCEMLPASTTCAFLPSSVIPGGGPITTTLNVITTAPSSASLQSPLQAPLYAAWLLAPLGLLVLGAGRRRRGRTVLGLLLLLLLLQAGCGGSDEPMMTTNPGTPVGTHTITIRGATGSLSHTATTMVVVQ